MLQTMQDIKWTVRVHRWTWLYVFSHTGSVSWKDPFNGMTGRGTWRLENNKIVTRWFASQTWETWDIPINPLAATGKCHMKEGTYDIKAEALNFIEIENPTVFSWTPESKALFLERCNMATGRVQIAQLQFSGWLSSVSIAYGDAFESHTKVLNDISARERLANELLLGFALAFVGGGSGGVVGGLMKAAGSSDFMVDGVKDLAKFAVRGPGGGVLRGAGITGMPLSPLQWQNRVNERVSKEMLIAAKEIDSWRTAVGSNDDSFDAGFDPAEAVDLALVIKLKSGFLRIRSLPEVDKASLQNDFEKGWLVAWIRKEVVSNIPTVRDFTRDKLGDYGRRLGLNDIEQLLDKHCPDAHGFPAGTFTQ